MVSLIIYPECVNLKGLILEIIQGIKIRREKYLISLGVIMKLNSSKMVSLGKGNVTISLSSMLIKWTLN